MVSKLRIVFIIWFFVLSFGFHKHAAPFDDDCVENCEKLVTNAGR